VATARPSGSSGGPGAEDTLGDMITTDSKWRGRRAALLLAVITPLIAELTLGNPPLSQAYLMLLWVPVYGAGTVLIRELARRAGAGWAGVLLLGLAYGVVEEGLVLGSLTSPTLYGAAGWAPRILGLNSAYTELNLPYHAVFSVALPILLAELVHPDLRHRPFLGRTGLVVSAVVFVLGGALVRFSVTGFIDPHYRMPVGAVVGCAAAVALLAVAALNRRLRPRAEAATSVPPAPWGVAVFGGVVAFAYLALLVPFGGAAHPAFTQGGWVAVPMVSALVVAAAAGWLVRRWTAGGGWTDRRSLALAGGALTGHTAFGLLANADTPADRIGLAALGVVMVGLLLLLGRRLSR
jgi:hypothetical protein